MNISFSTKVNIQTLNARVGYGEKGVALGSCFANNIGGKLSEGKFDFLINPVGITYNPASLSALINRALEGKPYSSGDFFEHEGLWKSYDFHSDMAHESLDDTCQRINEAMKHLREYLMSSKTIIITLGTSWIYNLVDTGKVVTNCHKQAASNFKRQRLSVSEMEQHLWSALDALFAVNPNVNILMTVSPIRHLKDGAAENQVSKASLLLATNQLCDRFQNVEYFPAYEIMIDELRDYRFYADDMIHPSSLAIEIIWQKFLDTVASDKTRNLYNDVMRIVAAAKHIPRSCNSLDYKKFKAKSLSRISELEEECKSLDFGEEKKYFSSS